MKEKLNTLLGIALQLRIGVHGDITQTELDAHLGAIIANAEDALEIIRRRERSAAFPDLPQHLR